MTPVKPSRSLARRAACSVYDRCKHTSCYSELYVNESRVHRAPTDSSLVKLWYPRDCTFFALFSVEAENQLPLVSSRTIIWGARVADSVLHQSWNIVGLCTFQDVRGIVLRILETTENRSENLTGHLLRELNRTFAISASLTSKSKLWFLKSGYRTRLVKYSVLYVRRQKTMWSWNPCRGFRPEKSEAGPVL